MSQILPPVFCAHTVKIWIVDYLTGMMKTYVNSKLEEEKILMNKGLITQIFESRSAQNIKNSL